MCLGEPGRVERERVGVGVDKACMGVVKVKSACEGGGAGDVCVHIFTCVYVYVHVYECVYVYAPLHCCASGF